MSSATTSCQIAIERYRQILVLRPRGRVPLEWAATQNDLGIALSTLGKRESGTERLEQAVAAFRLALHELTRERAPLDWARTQNNLGTVLWTLHGRESGTWPAGRRRSRLFGRPCKKSLESAIRFSGRRLRAIWELRSRP